MTQPTGIQSEETKLLLPSFIMTMVTSYCNYHCLYCPYHSTGVDDGIRTTLAKNGFMLTKEQFATQLDRILPSYESRGLAYPRFTFTGMGEPFLNPEMMDILEMMHDRGVSFGLLTNYSKAVTPYLDRVLELEPASIRTNLDAATADVHEFLCAGSDFQVTVENIRTTAQYIAKHKTKTMFAVHHILTKTNAGQLKSLIDLLSDCGVANLSLVPVGYEMDAKVGEEHFYHDYLDEQHVLDEVGEAYEYGKANGIAVSYPPYFDLGIKRGETSGATSQHCSTPRDSIQLNFDLPWVSGRDFLGNISCLCVGQSNPEHTSYGNLMEADFETIIMNTRRQELIQTHEDKNYLKDCLECNFYRMAAFGHPQAEIKPMPSSAEVA